MLLGRSLSVISLFYRGSVRAPSSVPPFPPQWCKEVRVFVANALHGLIHPFTSFSYTDAYRHEYSRTCGHCIYVLEAFCCCHCLVK